MQYLDLFLRRLCHSTFNNGVLLTNWLQFASLSVGRIAIDGQCLSIR